MPKGRRPLSRSGAVWPSSSARANSSASSGRQRGGQRRRPARRLRHEAGAARRRQVQCSDLRAGHRLHGPPTNGGWRAHGPSKSSPTTWSSWRCPTSAPCSSCMPVAAPLWCHIPRRQMRSSFGACLPTSAAGASRRSMPAACGNNGICLRPIMLGVSNGHTGHACPADHDHLTHFAGR